MINAENAHGTFLKTKYRQGKNKIHFISLLHIEGHLGPNFCHQQTSCPELGFS
jgi:hypothetical protein